MDVGASLVTDGKTAELGEPGERPLDLPAVSAETFAAVDAAPGNAWDDATGAALTAAPAVVVGLVGMQLIRAATRPPAQPSN
jgi:hypothetical protein